MCTPGESGPAAAADSPGMTHLQIECSWCHKVIAKGDPKRVTHGACVTCLNRYIETEWKHELERRAAERRAQIVS